MKGNETLGERIARIAAEKGKTLRWLARETGISYSTLYSDFRRKSNRVNRETLEKIAEALGITVAEILSEKTGGGESDGGYRMVENKYPPLKPNRAMIARENGKTTVMINFNKAELLSMLASVGIIAIPNDLYDLDRTYDLIVELRPAPIEKEA